MRPTYRFRVLKRISLPRTTPFALTDPFQYRNREHTLNHPRQSATLAAFAGAEPGETKRSGPRASYNQSGAMGDDAAGASADQQETDMVGDLDDQSGYDASAMPCAPDDARPAGFLQKVAPGAAGGSEAGSSPPGTPASRSSPMGPPPDKNEAFASFKVSTGVSRS